MVILYLSFQKIYGLINNKISRNEVKYVQKMEYIYNYSCVITFSIELITTATHKS